MNKKKLIPLLLFLLLLLLVLCVWCHANDITKNRATVKMKKEVVIIEAKIKKIIDFEHVIFELGKTTLTKESIDTVSHIADILNEHPHVNVVIEGHSDNTGDNNLNLELSQQRVNSVQKQLIEMKINHNRLKAVGYGETKPLVSNDTEENRRINRRVEFKVIGD